MGRFMAPKAKGGNEGRVERRREEIGSVGGTLTMFEADRRQWLFARLSIIRSHRLHAMHRCGLLPHMSEVAWSVRLCVGQTDELCKNGRTDRGPVWETFEASPAPLAR